MNLDLNAFDILEEGIAGDSNDRLPFTKFPEGNTHITVLGVAKARWTHFVENGKLTVNCPGKSSCPICAIMANAKANKLDCDYKSTQKFGMVVYNHGTKAVEILDQKITFIKGLKGMLNELKDDEMEFNPSKFVTRIRREGTGFNDTKYSFKVAPTASQADVPAEIIESVKDIVIDDLFLELNPDQLKQLISGKTLKDIFNPEAASDEVVVNFN